jgi:hypothetical protein
MQNTSTKRDTQFPQKCYKLEMSKRINLQKVATRRIFIIPAPKMQMLFGEAVAWSLNGFPVAVTTQNRWFSFGKRRDQFLSFFNGCPFGGPKIQKNLGAMFLGFLVPAKQDKYT